MSVNGIANTTTAYEAYSSSINKNKDTKQASSTDKTSSENTAAAYEKSDDTSSKKSSKIYKPDTATIEKLKADAEARSAQLRSLVEKMLTKQGQTFNDSTNIYSLLREGKLNVDPQTSAQAQKDIAEDGYWGVKQTSDRIVSFAKALTGGDPSKADEMIKAFQKGYDAAGKTWGGKLPDISQQTYDATMKQLNEWKNSLNEE